MVGLNSTPSAERVHIGIFGRRNAGKSSVINALTGQSLAIVSKVKGTTTDPVSKAMELLPLGPVVMIDTPGIDDMGTLGAQRVMKSYQVLNKTDIAVLVMDAAQGAAPEDQALILKIKEKKIPYVLVFNKMDSIASDHLEGQMRKAGEALGTADIQTVSALTGQGIYQLKETIAKQISNPAERPIAADLIVPLDFVLLVIPIDTAAPKGRLILPQQQTIRDLLEANAVVIVVKESELEGTLKSLGKKPALVITDSQVFSQVSRILPPDIRLTSFSILFARYKGELETLVRGVKESDNLSSGDKVLICEGCTHHRQCEDIGTVKIPGWLKQHTKADLEFVFTSGTEFPQKLSAFSLIIHCGGCMLNEREMKYRIACARDAGIPITNYGILIAYMHGILERSLEAFPAIYQIKK